MQVNLSSNRVTIGPSLRARIERLETTLIRLGRWVQRATVHIEEVSGLRGVNGCTQCQVVIKARGVDPVVVTETDENAYTSASRAIRRAELALKRRVKARRDRKRRVRTRSQARSECFPRRNGDSAMTSDAALTGKVVSVHNRQRLGSVIDEARRRGTASPDLLMFLEEKLELANCVPPTDIPDDVVTMNSKFRLRDLETDEVQTFVLCYPDAMGSSSGYVSALDPIGCAVLGCRVGDEIVSKAPIGARRFQLVEVSY